MQIVSIGDNLHKVSNPFFWEKIRKKYFKMLSAENFTQIAFKSLTGLVSTVT